MARERQRPRWTGQWIPPVWEFVVVCVVGLALIVTTQRLEQAPAEAVPQTMRAAADSMQAAMEVLAAYRMEHGPPIDLSTDINGTGLIGTFYSPTTTTVGNLEAKRTTTNPNMAAMLVDLLSKAGVEAGDFIAVGASGSFPALILATVAASQALDLRVGLIVSLGASQFGANLPELTWLDIERILVDSGGQAFRTVAASLGGDLDVARDLRADAHSLLQEKIETSGAFLIHESDLVRNVQQRMSIYRDEAKGAEIAAFVNVGGAWANMGVDASVLSAAPGLIQLVEFPDEEDRGVMHAMAVENVPVIHLLNIRNLIGRYGLPWDPSPLPAPGLGLAEVTGKGNLRRWPATAFLTAATLWTGSIALRRRKFRNRPLTTARMN
ncbi:poly-gamma-glutamate system protein [Candidatus Bipolaricaulota bacterium]